MIVDTVKCPSYKVREKNFIARTLIIQRYNYQYLICGWFDFLSLSFSLTRR